MKRVLLLAVVMCLLLPVRALADEFVMVNMCKDTVLWAEYDGEIISDKEGYWEGGEFELKFEDNAAGMTATVVFKVTSTKPSSAAQSSPGTVTVDSSAPKNWYIQYLQQGSDCKLETSSRPAK